MSGYTNVMTRATSLETSPLLSPFTGVRVWYDDENAYFSGDETGRVMEVDCPWATQAMADGILATITGYEYQPFTAQGAVLDPVAELGDGVNVGGTYGTLGVIDTEFGSLCAATIGAPSDEEIDHEYPYLTKQEREMLRKVSLGQSYYGTRITRASGLEIVKTDADGTEKSRVKLNSDVLAFYNDDGEEALYFDAEEGKYRFCGDVEVTGGTMNINNNFIVDADGNLTINGDINLSGGTITWGSNKPASGISASQAESIASTVITEELVASPKICTVDVDPDDYPAGSIIGMNFYGNEFNVDSEDSSGSFNLYGTYQNNTYHFFKLSYFEGDMGPIVRLDSPAYGYLYLGGYASALYVDSKILFRDEVDFSEATVTGLNIVFG